MHISPPSEHALIELANRGLWVSVIEDRLQLIATRETAGVVTDSLRHLLASNRAELLEVVPALEMPNLALTGAVVRVLFARLSSDDQDRAISLRRNGDLSAAYRYFTANYDQLGMPEKVIYLWAAIDGPRDVAGDDADIIEIHSQARRVMA